MGKTHNMAGGRARRMKLRLWAIQDGCCAHCGVEAASPLDGTVDHIIPRSRGGPNGYVNLLWSCAICNEEKADRYELSARAEMYHQRVLAWLREAGLEKNIPANWTRAGHSWSLEVV